MMKPTFYVEDSTDVTLMRTRGKARDTRDSSRHVESSSKADDAYLVVVEKGLSSALSRTLQAPSQSLFQSDADKREVKEFG